MNFKEKLVHIKEVSLQWIDENKKVVIPTGSVVIIGLVLIMNMNLIQISYFKIKEMPAQVVNILTKAKPREYTHFYFKQGLEYLVTDLSEVSQEFLEKNFVNFDEATKERILIKYNKEGLLFKDQKALFDEVISKTPSNNLKEYMKRLDIVTFERALEAYFGSEAKLTQDKVESLYKLLSLKGEKLPLEQFEINVYELLSFPHKGDIESTSIKLLDYIEATRVKEVLFTELKTKEIELETLGLWVDILNKKRIITTSEYVAFTNYNGMIKRLQEELKQIELQEVDLMNMKQSVDVQTEMIVNEVQKVTKEIADLNNQIASYTQEVSGLKTYKEVDLYILDRYENGEYEAAIPEKSWLFGTYKPGSQKVRLKLTRSNVVDVGVQSFKAYNKGKLDDGSIYYIEVSNEQLTHIKEVEDKIQADNQSISAKQNEVNKLNQDIAQIRKTNNYDSTISLLEELELKKSNIALDIEKNRLAIQQLFGIGNILV